LGGRLLEAFTGATGQFRIQPGLEILRSQIREVQQEVGQVTLGIDDQRRNPLQGSFLHDGDT
jgi:hypothetical protein